MAAVSPNRHTSRSPSKVTSPAKKKAALSRKINEAVKFFTDPTSDPKVRNNIKLSLALQTIVDEANSSGLSGQHILLLSDVAASGRFAASTSSRLIRSLIPSESVPEDAAVHSISWMCTNKPSHEIQALLLKWITMTFDLLDSTEQLHALYGMIFYFTENDTLCPHACHLLYLLTRREDVTAHRVRKLLSLQKRVGMQPHIVGLLSLYRVFAPHLVSLSLPATQRVYFKQTNRVWMVEIQRARDRIQESRNRGGNTSMHREVTHSTLTETTMVRKRRKLNPVPDLHSASLTLDPRAEVMTKVPLEQIKSYDEFLTNFDRLELPTQAAAILRSPVLQHLIVCQRDQHTIQRLNFWLSQALQTELMDVEGGDNPRTEQLLQLLINFTDFIQESIPVCEQFLSKYLLTWNGLDYRPYILRLVSRFRIYPFPVLNDLVLEPLRSLFFCSSVYFKCQVIHTLTELLRNFAMLEIPRYREAAKTQRVREEEAALQGGTDKAGVSVFSTRVEYFDPLDTLGKLIELVDSMCAVSLQMDRNHCLIMHHTMAFYELISSLYTKYGLVFLQLPSQPVSYCAVFGANPVACSRLCQVICNYRTEFNALKSNNNVHQQWDKFKQKIVDLNKIILTLCNCLWRNKAFDTTTDHGVTMATVKTTGIPHPNEIFSMQGSLATMSFCKKFFEETQPEDKRVQPRMVKSAYKPVYIDFLRRERMDGITEFMETFIRRTGASKTTINQTESISSQSTD